MIVSYIKNQFNEINNDRRLQVYGSIVSLTMVWTWMLWTEKHVGAQLANKDSILCWPFLQGCEPFLISNQTLIAIMLNSLLVLGLLSFGLFLYKRTLKIALGVFLAVHLIKLTLFWQSYRLMGNYHFMEFLVAFSFLFIPNKIATIRVLIVGFYVSAGSIKFNTEWFSAAAMPQSWIDSGLPGMVNELGLMPISNAYAVFLEMVVSILLLSRNRYVFWFAFLQYLAFHAFSWQIVGYFYPMVMTCLIMIFPISQHFKQHIPFRLQSRFAYAFLAIFFISQAYPKFLPGDQAITGEGRITALNMFDANAQCHSSLLINFKNETIEELESRKSLRMGIRIGCEPYVYFDRAKKICKSHQDNPSFQGVSLSLNSRQMSDQRYTQLVNIKNICSKSISYNSFFLNDWINK